MKGIILKFGLLAVLCMVLLELSRYSILFSGFYQEALLTVSALSLILFGFLVRKNWFIKREALQNNFTPNEEKLKLLEISNREYDVLKKMAEGLSNHEIGECLFVSENTVKTHVSKLFSKLDVKRRTEAVKKGREYGIL